MTLNLSLTLCRFAISKSTKSATPVVCHMISFHSTHPAFRGTTGVRLLSSSLTSKMGSHKATRVSAYEGFRTEDGGVSADIIVDLRSDTLTKPGKAMREAMANAEVGDDVFQEDLTVKELESRMASLLGKEGGLFVTSGTMGNLLAALTHCNERGSEIIVGDQAHMFCYEQGNIAQFGGIHSCQVPNNPDGTFDIKDVISRIRSDDIHLPTTKLICVENTHNRCGGRVLPLEWLDELAEVSKEFNIPMHMDGARIFSAGIASGVPVSRIVRDFNSVSICLSKGLGAPIGSVLVGDAAFIQKARRLRKALGGGMRQAGVIAAAGIYCLENNIDRVKEDHDNAQMLAKIVNNMKSPNVFIVEEDLQTGIIMLNVLGGIDVPAFCKRLGEVREEERNAVGALVSVRCLPWSSTRTRLVMHLDISFEMVEKAGRKICYVTKEFMAATK